MRAALISLLTLLNITAVAQVSELKFREPNLQDLYDLLDVRIYGGSFRFHKPYGEIRIEVDGYLKDQLVFTAYSGTIVSKNGETNFKPGVCEFRVAIVDLDVIHLRQGQPGHCRIFVGYHVKDATGSTAPTDIPKDKLDLSASFNRDPLEVESDGSPMLSPDSTGRTLLFQLSGGGGFNQITGRDGQPTCEMIQPKLFLRCYFVPKMAATPNPGRTQETVTFER
jgi:hypothetical protein